MSSASELSRINQLFALSGRVAVITGGAGLLGYYHAEILAGAGAHVVLLDLAAANPMQVARKLATTRKLECAGFPVDVGDERALNRVCQDIVAKFGRIDILINNAANNPKVEDRKGLAWSRLENLPMEVWEADIRVGLTGAFLCSRIFGQEMAKRRSGVIVNVASDLAIIAPDQRL